MADDDAELVALIDDELDEASKSRLLARLAQDEALRARYEALREARPQIAAAFSPLLDRAPLARLTAALATQSAPPPTRPSLRGFAWREFAAGLLIGLVAAGAAAWVALGLANRDRDDWRAAVVDYMKLYTNETF